MVALMLTLALLGGKIESAPNSGADIPALASAIGVSGKPIATADDRCSTPGVYAPTGKAHCTIVRWDGQTGLLYYPGAYGDSPKAVKAYRLDGGLWLAVTIRGR